MSKMRALLVGATVAGAFAASSFIPAQAEDLSQDTPVGKVVLQGDPATQDGAIVVDGNGTVPGPIGGGYIGVDSNQGVVGCANGTYTGSGDNVITAIPPAGAPDPTPGPCTPAP